MAGRIDCYVDIASFYSYLAFLELQRNRQLLSSHTVQVDFHPILLGGINAGSGNKPPWSNPVKAVYLAFDARRATARFPNLNIQTPHDLMAVSHTVLPLRALHYVKRACPSKFETTLHYLLFCFWTPPNMNLILPENLVKALSETPVGFRGHDGKGSGKKLFSVDEIKDIMAGATSQEMKDALKKTTQEALDRGAFGAPWMWVTNKEGKGEPFFGSDRFHFVYQFLGLPFQDVTLLPPKQVSGGKPNL